MYMCLCYVKCGIYFVFVGNDKHVTQIAYRPIIKTETESKLHH